MFLCAVQTSLAQAVNSMGWEELRDRFKKNNPNLLAAEVFIRENKAIEITAGLRPNPVVNLSEDQFAFFNGSPYRPTGATQLTHTLSYLVERRNKRGLRVQSAQLQTEVSKTDVMDLERQLMFTLRDSYIRVLQSKAVLELALENITAYDKVIEVNRERMRAGDIAKIDLSRVELGRVQFESDLINATVALRTAKIGMLSLLNEAISVDQFDVAGPYTDGVLVPSQDELRAKALAARPDLRSAATAIEKARNDNKLAWANGSTDPTLASDYARIGPKNTMGVGVSFPIKIFDKNQGEKERTRLEIERLEKVKKSIEVTAVRDVDSAYAAVESVRALLGPYKERYLAQSAEVRDTVSFSYSKGGASLLELLDAQKSYRDTQVTYRNLIASFLAAVNQLSLAAGADLGRQ